VYEIYLITNQVNEKIYVGQATRGRVNRFRRHFNDAKAGSSLPLHRAMRKYGFDKFTLSLLTTAKSKEDLNRLEVFWIKQLDSKNSGYNMTEGGEGCTGAVQSEESRAKKSRALMGKNKGKQVGEKGWRFRHDLDTKQIVDMYLDDKSTGQIGKMLGASKETITSRLVAAGVKLRSNSDAQKIRSSDPKELPCYRADISTGDVVFLLRQDLTYQEIGDKLGCSKRCVLLRLRKLGMSRPPRRCNLDKDKVVELYLEGFNAYEIGDRFAVSSKSIYPVLKERGIPIRSKSSQPRKSLRTEKICPLCKNLLPLSSYNKDRTTIDGHMPICRECKKQRLKDKERAKKEIALAQDSANEGMLGLSDVPLASPLSSPSQCTAYELST
jgi:group I intron endonuclease